MRCPSVYKTLSTNDAMNGERSSTGNDYWDDANVVLLGVSGKKIESTNEESQCLTFTRAADSDCCKVVSRKCVNKSVNGGDETSHSEHKAPSLTLCNIVYTVRKLCDAFHQIFGSLPVVHIFVNMAFGVNSEGFVDCVALYGTLGYLCNK